MVNGMNYAYSPSKNDFYRTSLMADYKSLKLWPDDAIEVSDDIYDKYSIEDVTIGNVRIPGSDGMPCWVGEKEK